MVRLFILLLVWLPTACAGEQPDPEWDDLSYAQSPCNGKTMSGGCKASSGDDINAIGKGKR